MTPHRNWILFLERGDEKRVYRFLTQEDAEHAGRVYHSWGWWAKVRQSLLITRRPPVEAGAKPHPAIPHTVKM